jgi:hypothetical protein
MSQKLQGKCMSKYFIIGDIAGQYKALMALVDKAPKDSIVISVGDMVDRGPDSNLVLNEFMTNPRFKAIIGNHEHMMLDYITNGKYYGNSVWNYNGGEETYNSFLKDGIDLKKDSEEKTKIVNYLSNLPFYIKENGIFISHSFPNPSVPLEDLCDLSKWTGYNIEGSIIWDRNRPKRMPGYIQVAGHNSHWGLKRFSDNDGEFAICLDTSRKELLTGLVWPDMTIIQQEYI